MRNRRIWNYEEILYNFQKVKHYQIVDDNNLMVLATSVQDY